MYSGGPNLGYPFSSMPAGLRGVVSVSMRHASSVYYFPSSSELRNAQSKTSGAIADWQPGKRSLENRSNTRPEQAAFRQGALVALTT